MKVPGRRKKTLVKAQLCKRPRKWNPKKKPRRNGLALIVGGAVVPSVIGSAMPGTMGVPLQTIGTGFSKFVAPTTAIVGAGMVMKQLKKFPKPKRIKRRR